MEKAIRVRAPAKINLHLRVYHRGEDGFHGILSVFQALSLADAIVVRSLKESDKIDIRGDFDCSPEETTLYRAARAFQTLTGRKKGLSIEILKRIPAGAGLGGGSSDAAALLVALDALFETGLPRSELGRLGEEIGSDVPFFLSGGAALVTGRGERIEELPARTDLSYLLIHPGVHVSTAWAYALLDREREGDGAEPDPDPAVLQEMYSGEPAAWPYLNSFEPYVTKARPEIGWARERLHEEKALFSRMSGSGSAVFGVFRDPDSAEAALARLVSRLPGQFSAWAVSPLACFSCLD